ncbi:MAG: HEAT repeat domain-containing protein [Planctomycetes bacterium]|nr:HEAT repeat domain-containing protein [Planctomycetota bacterium]MCB9830012.1 HEAT repeat domain-containing protein [Planctomycetota bacterium]
MSLAPSFRRPGGALHPGRQAPMDIRFCSVCNESIPDADFDAGRAITAGGRSQHVACALERATRMGSARSWWTSLLALYAAAATTFLLVAWLGRDKVPTEPTAVPAVTQARIADATKASEGRVVDLLEKRFEAFGSAFVRDEVEPRVGMVSTSLREEIQALDKRSAGSDVVLDERIVAIGKRQDGVENQVTLLTQWHDAIQRQADALEEGLRRVTERPPAPVEAPTPAPADEPAAGAGDPEVDVAHEADLAKWIQALSDKDPDLVFTATSELGRLKDIRATSPLIQVLTTHDDEFPRAGAAGALGMIRAADAVPALIEALLDKDELVQAAAGDAVEKITEQRFDFASGLALRERKNIQRAMRKWWKDNESAVRERLGQPLVTEGGN